MALNPKQRAITRRMEQAIVNSATLDYDGSQESLAAIVSGAINGLGMVIASLVSEDRHAPMTAFAKEAIEEATAVHAAFLAQPTKH